MSRREIQDAVADLRRQADAAVTHVHRITGLDAAEDLRDSQVLIVDRASWAKANSQSFAALMNPMLQHLAETRPEAAQRRPTRPWRHAHRRRAGRRPGVPGQQGPGPVRSVLRRWPGHPAKPADGCCWWHRTSSALERELNVDPADFRLWVCLHEQTHRVQFAAAPWLRDHMLEQIGVLSNGLMDKAQSLSGAHQPAGQAAFGRRRRTGRKPRPTAFPTARWMSCPCCRTRRTRRACPTSPR